MTSQRTRKALLFGAIFLVAIAERAEASELPPGEVPAHWRRRAIDWMTSHPGDALALASGG